MKRLVKTAFAFPFTLALILVLVLTAGTAIGSTFLGWPNEGIFQVAVDQRGHLRLLSPDIKGEHSEELKENEFLIELPSRQMVMMLESTLNEQQELFSQMESTLNEQQELFSQLESTLNEQQELFSQMESTISDLESRLSALESGDSGDGGPGDSDNITTEGLVLWLPMDEGQGSIVTDKSGSGNNGMITGATWTQLPNGLWYLSFDGADDKIDLGNNIGLYPAQFTWEFWLNVPDTGTNEAILGTPTDTRRPWEILAQGADDSIHAAIRQSNLTQVNTTFSDLKAEGAGWVHFTFTGDGTTLSGYLNGIASTTTGSYDGTLDTANRNNNILGVARTNVWYLNGFIGEVRLYNRALTPLEIENNYLVTKWRYN